MTYRDTKRLAGVLFVALFSLTLVTCGDDPVGPEGDTTKPAEIADLGQTGGIMSNAATLSWTATGDDGTTGRASAYDMRYHTDSATLANNWVSGTVAASLPEPASSGATETYQLDGLSAEGTYFVGIMAIDEADNKSDLSNIARVVTGPNSYLSPISDLTVDSVIDCTAYLSWTATGNGTIGAATSYDLRYTTDSATLIDNWNIADVANDLPIPQAPGATEKYQLGGLIPGVMYYIGVRAIDDEINVSDLSNIVSAKHSLRLFLPYLQTSECGAVAVPMTVQNFTVVVGIELRIGYDELQANFDSLSSSHFDVEYINDSDGVVRFIWADLYQTNPLILNSNDTLLWLHYSSLSGTSSLTFEAPVYVTDTAGTHLPLDLTDGSMTCTGE